jgi:hypothetical protein
MKRFVTPLHALCFQFKKFGISEGAVSQIVEFTDDRINILKTKIGKKHAAEG